MTLQIADCRLRTGWQVGVVVLALLAGGCTAGKAFRQGEASMKAGNVDEAVAAYRKASQAAPNNASYRIALSRAMQTASRAHLDKAHEYERQDQLDAALGAMLATTVGAITGAALGALAAATFCASPFCAPAASRK
jgi:tetratricopeptide (TPR) repeat protein